MHAQSVSSTKEAHGQRPVPKDFRPDIEGLRGFTLLAIPGFRSRHARRQWWFRRPDIFFFISGFVITGALWREVSTTGTIGMRRFFGRRARRLLPVSATVGIVTMIASAVLLPLLQAQSAIKDGIACALYVPNYWFIAQQVDYFSAGVPSPFQHYWTLGMEEQFYLLWPPMIIGTAWFVRRMRRRAKTDAPLSKSRTWYSSRWSLLSRSCCLW